MNIILIALLIVIYLALLFPVAVLMGRYLGWLGDSLPDGERADRSKL